MKTIVMAEVVASDSEFDAEAASGEGTCYDMRSTRLVSGDALAGLLRVIQRGVPVRILVKQSSQAFKTLVRMRFYFFRNVEIEVD